MPNQEYPEHEKQKAVLHKSQPQGEFLEWLSDSEQIALFRWSSQAKEWIRIHETPLQLLAKFHDIDLQKLEKEKQSMLELLRSQHQTK